MREKYLIGIPGEDGADVALQYDRENEELMVRSGINYADVLDNVLDSLDLENKCRNIQDKSGVHMKRYFRYSYKCNYSTFKRVRSSLEKGEYVLTKTRKLWRK